MLEFYKRHYMKGNPYFILAFDIFLAIALTATSQRFWDVWAMKAAIVLLWFRVVLTLICTFQSRKKSIK
jgi:hypothetical protein